MFNELAVFLLDMGRDKLPTMGDWNWQRWTPPTISHQNIVKFFIE